MSEHHMYDHFDPSDDLVGGARIIAIVLASAAITCVACVWLALWAINKPVHPDACGSFRGAECMAAVTTASR
jgi:hypothetical protein